ncbi:MAG: DUF3422 domain-containing protein [Betaproteobacteria bacterium]|nr:DUF3422 domain-containing protein [Betaproteobacteria bacterium]
MRIESDPQRDFVWLELHARPYVRFSAPAHVLHLSFLSDETTKSAYRDNLERLVAALHLAATYETPRHSIHAAVIERIGRLVMAWEQHTEFSSCTLFLYELQIPFDPFGFDWLGLLPGDWLKGFGRRPLVATGVAIGTRENMPTTPEGRMALFEGHTVNGSEVMAGGAEVWSAYRAHTDGFGRIAVIVDQMSPHELGRTVERLLTIENSYHFILLSLPLAQELKPSLAAAESRMVSVNDALLGADSVEQKRALLDSLFHLAAEVEHLNARIADRFAATFAYFAILESRFAEVREDKIKHVSGLSQFVMRRLRPAVKTCRSTLERLTNLFERINRASDLLRTSIELSVQEHSQRLLESSDHRAWVQLRLQDAVQILSVVVIGYYVLGLLGYLLQALRKIGVGPDPEVVIGLAVLPTLVAVWALLHQIRRRFRDRSE